MSLIFGDILTMKPVLSSDGPGGMGSFSRYQTVTYICSKCQREFKGYPGMVRRPGNNAVARCPEHARKEPTNGNDTKAE